MSLVERCKTKYQKRKVLYNLAGVMALTFAVATITHGVVKRNCVPRLLDVVDRPGTESTNSFSFFRELRRVVPSYELRPRNGDD